jgi:hypothetical protein
LSGCPGNCHGHGQCKTNHLMEWECWCESGWFGAACDIYMEQDCSDRKDNDDGEKWNNLVFSYNRFIAPVQCPFFARLSRFLTSFSRSRKMVLFPLTPFAAPPRNCVRFRFLEMVEGKKETPHFNNSFSSVSTDRPPQFKLGPKEDGNWRRTLCVRFLKAVLTKFMLLGFNAPNE